MHVTSGTGISATIFTNEKCSGRCAACMLQAFSKYDSTSRSDDADTDARQADASSDSALLQLAGEDDSMTSSTGAAMTSWDHVTAGADDDASSCSPSSVTIVDLDATIDDDQHLEAEDADSSRRPTTSPLRVPTPSSWEKYRLVASSSSSTTHHQSTSADSVTQLLVMTAADRRHDPTVKDDVDTKRSTVKKPCSCGALAADMSLQVDFNHA